jgi:DNA-directed RNA polymerase subunit K/omega
LDKFKRQYLYSNINEKNYNSQRNRIDFMTLTKYELARLIGARALQLAHGAPPLIKTDNELSSIAIAEKELSEGVIPLIVLRKKEQ